MALTLNEMLKAQGDLGEKSINEIIGLVVSGSYPQAKDPISDIIVNAYENNRGDMEGVEDDLQYAINQLTRVMRAVSNNIQ
ncbi:MAG: hypothetical protein V4643_10770 [Bacteroidota bacterium]